MFPGPAQRKQIDKIGQIFSGFLSTSFSGPKSKQHMKRLKNESNIAGRFFFACLFLVRSPQNKPKQLYYVAQFPMASPSKKIYILYLFNFFCRRFSRDQPSKKINICIYIYMLFFLFGFFSPIFPQPAPPFPPQKKTYILFIFLSPICPRPALQKI